MPGPHCDLIGSDDGQRLRTVPEHREHFVTRPDIGAVSPARSQDQGLFADQESLGLGGAVHVQFQLFVGCRDNGPSDDTDRDHGTVQVDVADLSTDEVVESLPDRNLTQVLQAEPLKNAEEVRCEARQVLVVGLGLWPAVAVFLDASGKELVALFEFGPVDRDPLDRNRRDPSRPPSHARATSGRQNRWEKIRPLPRQRRPHRQPVLGQAAPEKTIRGKVEIRSQPSR